MKFFYKIILAFSFLTFSVTAFATHNRAGEITYKHLSGFTYQFTITTYTKVSGISADADRTRLGISWGDGTFDSLNRASQVFCLQISNKINTSVFTRIRARLRMW